MCPACQLVILAAPTYIIQFTTERDMNKQVIVIVIIIIILL